MSAQLYACFSQTEGGKKVYFGLDLLIYRGNVNHYKSESFSFYSVCENRENAGSF